LFFIDLSLSCLSILNPEFQRLSIDFVTYLAHGDLSIF